MNHEPHDRTHPGRQSAEPGGADSLTVRETAPVRISAHHEVVKKLGCWTTERRLEVRASGGLVVLDLLLPRLQPGTVELGLDLDHATVKLLVPDGAVIDSDDLRRVGRGRIKDWTGSESPGGQLFRLVGEIRSSEVRIHRGGVALVQLMLDPRSRSDVRQAQREGRLGDHGPNVVTGGRDGRS
jgi:hypothetical protein